MARIPYFDPLSLQDIAMFFKAPTGSNIVFKNYYRGGTLVDDTLGNFTVPVSGALAIKDFYATGQGRVLIYLIISANTYSFDVYANRTSAYIAGASDITVLVQTGVYVGSNVAGTAAITVSNSFNTGDTITVINNGFIYGRGGNGGDGYHLPGQPGGTGGTGLYVGRPATVANYGEISTGGGGGGGGALYIPYKGPYYPGGGGGGGGGYAGGSGGGGQGSGTPGTLNTGGAGGPGSVENYGSAGGARAAAGVPGGPISGANPGPGGTGGAAGYAVLGTGYITWVNMGTITGAIG